MNLTVLETIAATGFTIAFLHVAIPTHWLPFVLVSRARGWGRAKTLSVTAIAGFGHIMITSLLGLAIAWFGFKLNERIGSAFPWVAAGVLWIIGIFYLWRQLSGRGVMHHHFHGGHHEPGAHCGHEEAGHSHMEDEIKDTPLVSQVKGDWAVIGGLLVMLTLSPCEEFLPVYLSGVQFGWAGFWVLSAILALGALAGMILFTWLAMIGMEKIELKKIERWESGLLGAVFVLLGVIVIILSIEIEASKMTGRRGGGAASPGEASGFGRIRIPRGGW